MNKITNSKNSKVQSGFTLIELILVVGIVAILAVMAIGKFTDVRRDSARKSNVASIKNVTRTINTEIARLDGESQKGMFAYAESLIDSAVGGGDVFGAEGSYKWDNLTYNGSNGGNIPGIYCGIKLSEVTANAKGQTTGTVSPIATAHENNVGLEDFASKLGLYYLTSSDVSALKEAGISIVSRHNYSTAQATTTLKWTSSKYYTEMGLHSTGGGPGSRPDLSACYPVVLTNGSALAVLNPASCESIYRDLGLTYSSTNNISGLSSTNPETYYDKGICIKLYAIGLGRDCEATTKLFENAPRCPTLDKTHYRNYLLLFSQNSGKGNSGNTVKFVGVIDPAGNTIKQAQYNADWAS